MAHAEGVPVPHPSAGAPGTHRSHREQRLSGVSASGASKMLQCAAPVGPGRVGAWRMAASGHRPLLGMDLKTEKIK